ncbi:hypothetical protein D3C71_1565940 [compost metagenome]
MTMTVSQSSRRSERGSASELAAQASASVTGPGGGEEDMGQGKEKKTKDRFGSPCPAVLCTRGFDTERGGAAFYYAMGCYACTSLAGAAGSV